MENVSSRSHITFVSERYTAEDKQYFKSVTAIKLRERIKEIRGPEHTLDYIAVKSPNDLFPMFSDPNFRTDLIIFDVESVSELTGTSVFEAINTMSTLAKCTVCRTDTGKTGPRDIVLAASMTLACDPKLLKLALGTDIHGIYPRGSEFTIDEKVTAIVKLLDHEHYVPKRIKEILHPVKKSSNSTGIRLTPRQEQVLSLIRERGASNKSIAKILKISESAVKLHVSHILRLYGVKNRTQLALFSEKR